MKRTPRIAAMLGALTLTATASAVTTPDHLKGRPPLEVASGTPARAVRMVDWHRPPRPALAAWNGFLAASGSRWVALWDASTGVPLRIYGEGLDAPGTVASAEKAEAFSRKLLARHLRLLAPGASPGDFVLAANDRDGGYRTVGFYQHRAGVRVLGGQVSFRFKNDRMILIGSEALPRVTARIPASPVSAAQARASAEAWVLSDSAARVASGAVDGPFVLPLVAATRSVAYRTVLRVVVHGEEPLGRYDVYVDAGTGEPVAREQTLRFAEGTVQFNAPQRYPLSTRQDYPATFMSATVNGANVQSTATGAVTWADPAPANVTARVTGPYVLVHNELVNGVDATHDFVLGDGQSYTWKEDKSEHVDAQITTFVHASKVREFAKVLAPSMNWLNSGIDAFVNIDDACNAFFDGNINFFLSNNWCENTGRIADVVYHEFGHGFHYRAVIPGVGQMDGALGEGQADYLACTITGDPGMGRGFFKSSSPLRQLDPANGEWTWPDDVGEIHDTGRIIGGALWDLRKALIQKLGDAEGRAITDNLYYQGIRRAVDIPSMYPEIIAADDDDGNLDNGTPHICEINEAFARHGLYTLGAEVDTLSAETPTLEGYKVSARIVGLFEQCGAAAVKLAKVEWQLRSTPEVGGTIDMVAAGDAYEATIPAQPDGNVIQYRVSIQIDDDAPLAYPNNPADPYYELYVGPLEPIYCIDFEYDPADDGWTHELASGTPSEGADDWTWGVPAGVGGDPAEAFSGKRVFGNDLGGGNFNGEYQDDKVNYALSPVIDASGYDGVRLQYRRWLNVEDAFFDQATIYANDQLAWQNLNSDQGDNSDVHHRDREWRFHDVDLTPFVLPDGTVQLKFEIASDGGFTLGGWTLDDVCVLGFMKPAPVCGDGVVGDGEACDLGAANSDTAADGCRTSCQSAHCGDGVVDTGEACDDGNTSDGDACSANCQSASAGTVDVEEGGSCSCRTAGNSTSSSRLPPSLALLGLAAAALGRWGRRSTAKRHADDG